jgi:hypothetical protein
MDARPEKCGQLTSGGQREAGGIPLQAHLACETTPPSRLILHETIISERTRDKQSAARRKGEWTGGYPMLGYDGSDPSVPPVKR